MDQACGNNKVTTAGSKLLWSRLLSWLLLSYGGLELAVAHLLIYGVTGSSPIASTILRQGFGWHVHPVKGIGSFACPEIEMERVAFNALV